MNLTLADLLADPFLPHLAEEALTCRSYGPEHVGRRTRLQSMTRSLLVDLGVDPGDIDEFQNHWWFRMSAPSALAQTLLLLGKDHPDLPVHDAVGFALACRHNPGTSAAALLAEWQPHTRHGWAYLLCGINLPEYKTLRARGRLPDRGTLDGMLALRVRPTLALRT